MKTATIRVSVGPVDSLQPGGQVSIVDGDRRVVVFNIDGGLHAIDASCAHRGGPLEEGVLTDGVVTCPWHFHRYDVKTGERTDLSSVSQAVYPVFVVAGVVVVDLPKPKPPQSMRERLLEHAKEWDRDN